MGIYHSIFAFPKKDRHVVIVGGGYAGIELASILKKWKVPFTLIDPKEYFHHNVGALRAVVDEGKDYMKATVLNHKKIGTVISPIKF